MKLKWPKPDFECVIRPYGVPLYVFCERGAMHEAHQYLTKNAEKARTEMELSSRGVTAWMQSSDGEMLILLGWFNGGDSTLVHELGHVCLFLSDHVGYDPRKETEPFCYMLGDLFSSVRRGVAKSVAAKKKARKKLA